jgi:mannose-1-phosphate guanylyltransferase
MAGGIGSRFWPLSRIDKPKQFLDFLDTGKTLLQQTYNRFIKICPKENILVVTNGNYSELVFEQLPGIKPKQVLLEPLRKNTAPCIAYANYKIQKVNPEATVVVAPSDHLILKESEFVRVIRKGLEFVKNTDSLLTLGITPDRPETGYGYIQATNGETSFNIPNLKKVKTFTEKPDYEMARVFYESGEFFWNSGIFIWSLKSIMQAFEKHLPEVNILFAEGKEIYNTEGEKDFILNTYSNCKNISIDYGIMEKAENVYVLCSDFGWSDLGTWGSIFEHSPKQKGENVVSGKNVFIYDMKNSFVKVPNDKLVVLQGLESYIVVESQNMLLICKREDEQKIKQFVNDIKIRKGEKYV